MTRLMALIKDFKPEPEPQYASDRAWYADQFNPVDDESVDYKPVAEYARTLWTKMNSTFETIDKKAEWLFGLGLLSVGAMSWMAKEWGISWWLLIPPMFCAFSSLLLAMRARIPRNSFLPLSTKAAIERAESDPEHFDAWLAASTHVAVTGLILVCNRKAVLTKWSAGILIVGAFFLSIATLLPHSTTSPKPSAAPSSQAGPNKTP